MTTLATSHHILLNSTTAAIEQPSPTTTTVDPLLLELIHSSAHARHLVDERWSTIAQLLRRLVTYQKTEDRLKQELQVARAHAHKTGTRDITPATSNTVKESRWPPAAQSDKMWLQRTHRMMQDAQHSVQALLDTPPTARSWFVIAVRVLMRVMVVAMILLAALCVVAVVFGGAHSEEDDAFWWSLFKQSGGDGASLFDAGGAAL